MNDRVKRINKPLVGKEEIRDERPREKEESIYCIYEFRKAM